MSDKKTKAELYQMLAQAVRNTQPQPEPVRNTQPEPKRTAKIKSARHKQRPR